jgi:pimeloyl-ACP methyl ester carboxylesterase
MARLIDSPDGRTLEIHEYGPAEGPLIVHHHGTPVSGMIGRATVADATQRGARLVGITRPGYGGSTRRPGRSIADATDDVRAVLDELGVERCVSWGVSGGGPHALACAALLGDRVAAVASLASIAPYGDPGLDFLAGMGEDNVTEFGAALEGEAALRAFVEAELPGIVQLEPEQLADGLASLVSEVDRAALTGEHAEEMLAAMKHGLSSGGDGWIDDDLAFASDWGFALADIAVPVLLWQGDHDLMVPPAHGAWLAERIPGVEAHLSPDDGHLTLVKRRIADVHAWLLERL